MATTRALPAGSASPASSQRSHSAGGEATRRLAPLRSRGGVVAAASVRGSRNARETGRSAPTLSSRWGRAAATAARGLPRSRRQNEVARSYALPIDTVKRTLRQRIRPCAAGGMIIGGVIGYAVMPKACDVGDNMFCQYTSLGYPFVGIGVGGWAGILVGYLRERRQRPLSVAEPLAPYAAPSALRSSSAPREHQLPRASHPPEGFGADVWRLAARGINAAPLRRGLCVPTYLPRPDSRGGRAELLAVRPCMRDSYVLMFRLRIPGGYRSQRS